MFCADTLSDSWQEAVADRAIDYAQTAWQRLSRSRGILLCVMDNRDLTKCECFIDLALAETKERVNQMLVAAMADWANLKNFAPRPS